MAQTKTATKATERELPGTHGGISRQPKEFGASGTENYGGYITGEDYNAKLAPPNGFRIYDEMRRSDPQVRASLEVLKLPLQSATWTIQGPDDATPQEQELVDFCTAALLEPKAMTETWDYTLRHALLCLDFGCAPLEKVFVLKENWAWGLRVGLDRLAPRLPRTLERFHVDDRGKLLAIDQQAVKAGQYQTLTIPADRLVHLVHRREGDNYFGESILRAAYKPWFFKFQAERADAVRIYRQVAGIPMASLDLTVAKEVSAPTPTVDEIAAIDRLLAQMAASGLTYIRTNTLWKWGWLQGDGKNAHDVETAIKRHDIAILRNVLADFMAGGADGLNSGKTRTLTDFFGAALYALAQLVQDEFTLHVLQPLCEFNFPTQGLRLPRLEVDDVQDIDVSLLAENLSKLGAADFITADDSTEDALRKVMGLVPRDPTTTRTKAPPPVFGQPPAPGGEKDPAGDPGTGAGRDAGKDAEAADKEAKAAELRALAAAKGGVVFGGRIYAREPNAFELYAFNVAEVPDTLDQTTAALQAELHEIRRKQLDVLAAKLAKRDSFASGRPDDLVVPFKKDVEQAFKRALTRVYTYGRTQVQVELAKQGADVRLVANASVLLASGPGKNSRTAKSALTTSAKIATEKETDYWVNRIIEAGARLRRNGLTGADLAAAIVRSMGDQVEQATLPIAKSEVNEGFAIGRQAEATAQKDQIDYVEYSCLLDANSCAACEAEDGKTFAMDSEEYFRLQPPFSECEGNKGQPDACRCAFLYHAKSGASL